MSYATRPIAVPGLSVESRMARPIRAVRASRPIAVPGIHPGIGQTAAQWTESVTRAGTDIARTIADIARGPSTTPTYDSTLDPSLYTPTPYYPATQPTSPWLMPVVIGGGLLLAVGAWWMMSGRGMQRNRRRRRRRLRGNRRRSRRSVRRNYSYEHTSHPDKYDTGTGRPRRNRRRRVRGNRLTARMRGRIPLSKFVFPQRRAWPLDSAKRARSAVGYLHMGRVASASDFAKIRNEIRRRYPDVWTRYGHGLTWDRIKSARSRRSATRRRRRTARGALRRVAANRPPLYHGLLIHEGGRRERIAYGPLAAAKSVVMARWQGDPRIRHAFVLDGDENVYMSLEPRDRARLAANRR